MNKTTSILCMVAAVTVVGIAGEVDLRTARVTVVDPANLSQKMAAEELEKHLALIAGSRAPASNGYEFVIGRVAPGHAAAKEWESHAATTDKVLYFWGDDAAVDGQRRGSLIAVYGFLGEVLGVKWVRPGDGGIVYTRSMKAIIPDGWTHRFMPPLEKSEIRSGRRPVKGKGPHPPQWYNDEITPVELRPGYAQRSEEYRDFRIWRRRMRLVSRAKFTYGHAFTKWNERFLKSHREYLAMWDGTKRGRTRKERSGYIHLCYSNPETINQVIRDWLDAGTNKYLNVCAADSKSTHCRCDGCRALDADAPGEEFLADKSDRQVWFWNRVAEKAKAIRPDVKLISYIYANYRQPPRRWRIEHPDNLIAGVVPSLYDDSNALIRGWQAKGLKEYFVRPNYLWYKGSMPRGMERYLFEDFKENLKLGMIGVDEDNATRSFSMVVMFEFYALACVIADPTLSFEQVEREYLSQFGAAAEDMKEYYGRVRARGEASRIDRMKNKEAIKALDDSQLAKLSFMGHTMSDLDGDLAVVERALSRMDLSDAERRRVTEVKYVVEHAKLALDFFDKAAVKGGDSEFLATADRLMAFRLARAKEGDMREGWQLIMSDKKSEAPLWRRVKAIRK